ncbi:ATP-grasp domain-containing protein [Nocardia sp. 2]|uniref:ATP-grasp domain-containing protein n=1 Tax=Nocardia acididurans TaxID=2802282 RepID=A0ABS1MDJ3_9NOCA|nr:ATP-grasp domain-containing protein [Nocardia acididurans]MBL1078721.1 ATP-grasp domain-containing protein [Nocardia acididurans]
MKNRGTAVAARMSFCFLVEEQYRRDGMPGEVAHRLRRWGHRVEVLRPGGELLALNSLLHTGSHDAWVLKTVSGGPGLGLLEAAAATGLTTVNDARAIRGVRDKAAAAVIAAAAGLPVPPTWAAARLADLARLPSARYPLVVKPADGSSGRGVHRVERPEELLALAGEFAETSLVIAQPYVPNSGVDLKVYCVGGRLYGTERTSPLAGARTAPDRPVPLTAEVAEIAARIGEIFGLDLYGVDIVLGPDGPVVVDINDFPSFRKVPDAVETVAAAVIDLARNGSSHSRLCSAEQPGRIALAAQL